MSMLPEKFPVVTTLFVVMVAGRISRWSSNATLGRIATLNELALTAAVGLAVLVLFELLKPCGAPRAVFGTGLSLQTITISVQIPKPP
jgi:hypothetical protein